MTFAVGGTRQKLSMIATVTNQGKTRWMIIDESFNSDKLIELFYLPSYSPELNPEERLNADLKQALYTRVPIRTKAKLKAAATEHMQSLEKSPERVRKFFQDARVKYAA